MKTLVVSLLIILFSHTGLAARHGKINVSEADLYQESNFESDIMLTVKPKDEFLVSKKNYDGFYKIKLKSGKIGFLPDHEVEINGKAFQPKPFLDDVQENQKVSKKNKLKKEDLDENDITPEEAKDSEDEAFDFNLRGISLQLINYHEDTLGSLQVDDLLAIGYKQLSDTSYEVFASFKAPKYYSEKTGGSAQGFNLWGTYGINNTMPFSSGAALRYGGSFMGHFSQIKVTGLPKSYDLQDLTIGFVLEGGLLLHFKKAAMDFSVKYFFDRNNYAGFGLSLLF